MRRGLSRGLHGQSTSVSPPNEPIFVAVKEYPTSLADALRNLPPGWPHDPSSEIEAALRLAGKKIVAIDDDPTGTQTVHDIPVLTEWPLEALCEELRNDLPAFYLLTNSRAFPLRQACKINAEIGNRLREAAKLTNREIAVVSRSDSTLRGHFPGEVDALTEALDGGFDGCLLCPYFGDSGRLTIGDVHYLVEGDRLLPAGQSEFARDHSFGYRASNLLEWVEEKSKGRIKSEQTASISLGDIRIGGPDVVARRLSEIEGGTVVIINAANRRDLECFMLGLLKAEAVGKRFIYRTGASFVAARAGISPRSLLATADLVFSGDKGGLFVVGSYVSQTTIQVENLIQEKGVVSLKLPARELIDKGNHAEVISQVAVAADQSLDLGQDVVIYTSRELVADKNAEKSLSIGRRISEGLVETVRQIQTRPRYLVAKGGITSSEVATKAMGVKRAMVSGQILPGVPVWEMGSEARHPGLPFIVFPGNVGDDYSLRDLRKNLGSISEENVRE